MKVIALPTTWSEEEELQPIDVHDIDVVVTPSELAALANFFGRAAKTLRESGPAEASKEFADTKTNPQTGIWLNVKLSTGWLGVGNRPRSDFYACASPSTLGFSRRLVCRLSDKVSRVRDVCAWA